MKRKLMIPEGLFILLQFGFSYYDVVKGEKIVYVKYGIIKELKKVDFRTFKKLDSNLGIDKEHLFIYGEIVEGIDVKTFEVTWRGKDEAYAVPGNICEKRSHIERFKDKNGEYEIKDIWNGKLEIEK